METWTEGQLCHLITKVLKRFKHMLCNIVEAGGGNDLIKTKCGTKHWKIRVEDVIKNCKKMMTLVQTYLTLWWLIV